MDEIDALERRIAAALDRIDGALARPDPGAGALARLESEWANARAEEELARGEQQRLARALEDEQLVGQQIRARNEVLHQKLDAAEAELAELAQLAGGIAERDAEIDRLKAEIAQREALAGQLRRVNMQLRQNNLMLRDAVQSGMGDPHLVNKAMLTELESIRLVREAERAEIDGILAGLRELAAGGGAGGGAQDDPAARTGAAETGPHETADEGVSGDA